MLSAKMLPPSTQRKASSLWQRWLGKRFAVEQSKVLQQRDIFVFFNREGYIYFMLLLLTFIAGINYANNLILAMCFLLSGILILSFYLAFLQLYGLTVSYQVPALGQVGSALVVPLNFTPKAGYVHVHLRAEYANQYKKITLLEQPLTVPFELYPLQRGRLSLPRFQFNSVYPFGIIRAWSLLYPTQTVWIAPQPLPIDTRQYGFDPLHGNAHEGIDDFSHLRTFQSGDAYSRVAWQQLAKGRGLLVKQFEQAQSEQLHFYYHAMPASQHEDKLSQLMYLVQQAVQNDLAFQMTLPTQHLPYGQGITHSKMAQLFLAQEP